MKKHINNKLYNTDTSEVLGVWKKDVNKETYEKETLYKKRTGEFFIHGTGGESSRYCRMNGQNRWSGTETIIPLKYENAILWAKEKLTSEQYDKIFGEINIKKEEKVVISFSTTTLVQEKIKRAAIIDGVSISKKIEQLILENL